MANKFVQLPDEELERLAREQGPKSVAAKVLAELCTQRALDRQVFAFRFGPFWIAGPVPDARTEAGLLEFTDDDCEE